MPPFVYEKNRTAEFLLSEAHGQRSRENATLSPTTVALQAGQLLTLSGAGSATVAPKTGGNTGNGTISAVTIKSSGKAGAYRAVFTAPTKFSVIDPDGHDLVDGKTGTAYATDLGFTITAGATAFAIDDEFVITVAPALGKYAPYDPTKAATAPASAVLYDNVPASEVENYVVVIRRDAEISADLLIGLDATSRNALAEEGLIVRD